MPIDKHPSASRKPCAPACEASRKKANGAQATAEPITRRSGDLSGLRTSRRSQEKQAYLQFEAEKRHRSGQAVAANNGNGEMGQSYLGRAVSAEGAGDAIRRCVASGEEQGSLRASNGQNPPRETPSWLYQT
jgi:hypothetical protein